jgi:hypothetical protein
MDTAQFVSDLNVSRFLDRLQLAHDPSIRASLQRLLLEEEDNFGDRAERLHNAQRHIAEGYSRIERQKALLAKLKADRKDVRLAERTLSNLLEIQRILEQYRQSVLHALDRSSL